MKRIMIFLIFYGVSFSYVFGQSGDIITMVAPGDTVGFDWPVVTVDGRGLYNRIYSSVFALEGIEVEIQGMPTIRCKNSVLRGDADLFAGGESDEVFEGYSFITPRYAVWYTEGVALFYKKANISHWEGPESLVDKQIVAVNGSNHLEALQTYSDLISREIAETFLCHNSTAALRMVREDRVDVFIASYEYIQIGLTNLAQDINPQDYEIVFLDRCKYYPLFQNTQRGRELARIFDEGMEQLAESGELQRFYMEDPLPLISINNMDPELLIDN